MTALRLTLFGGFALEPAERMAKAPKKVKALLAYLALNPGVVLPRPRLAALLWDTEEERQPRQSLRQALADLRKLLPQSEAVLVITSDSVTLRPGAIDVDVLELRRLHASDSPDALARVVDLYRGELLEGLDTRAPLFEEWLALENSRVRESALAAMTSMVEHCLAAGTTPLCVEVALRLLALDPWRESAHRALMQFYAREGRYGAALKQFQTCRAVLARELGVAPEPATIALYNEIARGRKGAPGPSLAGGNDFGTSVDEAGTAADAPVAPSAELLPVAALGIRLANFGVIAERRDPEELREALRHFYHVVDAETRALAGVVVKRASERVVAAFGLPRGERSDSERAARAAAAMHRAIAPLALCIGLATGRVLRESGGERNPEHGIVGHCIALAAHLADAAPPGQTFVDDEAYQGLAARFDSRPVAVGALAGGGKMRAWRLGAERTVPRRGFIGRDRELRLLSGALAACKETACGQSLLVRGEAGIGKSRLIEEFEGLAVADGFAVHKALVLDFGAGIGQDASRTLCRHLLDLNWASPTAEVEAASARALDAGLVEPSSIPFLRDLLGLPLSAHAKPAVDAMAPEVREENRQATLAHLVETAAARRPLLLVVEDIHWADGMTLARLATLARRVATCSALLVMSTRVEAEPLDPAWRGAMHGAPLATIDLGPLREAEAMALGQRWVEGQDDFVRRCVQRAEGNPFYLEQFLCAGDHAPDQVPHSVQSLVCARLDRLPAADKEAARAAAVMGQRFSLAALRHLLGDPSYGCDPLMQAGLVRSWADWYLFSHALIAEGTYQSLPKSERNRLHRAASEWYRDRDPVLCAEHLDRAGDPGAAAAYLRAARAQTAIYRNSDALRLVQRGLDLQPDAADRQELACLEAELLQESGAIDESIAAYERAIQRATRAPERCRALIGIAAGLRVQDRYREALDVLTRAEQAATSPAERAMIHFHRGNVMVPLGRTSDCLAEHEQALLEARAADSPVLEALASSGLGDAYYLLGRMRSSCRHFSRCINLCRTHGLGRIEMANLAMRGATRFYFLELGEAIGDVRAALELAVQAGNRRAEAISRNVLGYLLFYAGDNDEARSVAQGGLELARTLGSKRFEIKSLLNLGLAAIGLGENAVAENALDEAYALAEQARIDLWTPWVLGATALAADDEAKRRWALHLGDRHLARGSVGHSYLHFYQLALEALLRHGEWDAAERYTAMLNRYVSEESLEWSSFFVARARALTRRARGGVAAEALATSELDRLQLRAQQVGLGQGLVALERAPAFPDERAFGQKGPPDGHGRHRLG